MQEYWNQFHSFSWPLFFLVIKYTKLSSILFIQQNKACSHDANNSWEFLFFVSLILLALNTFFKAWWNVVRKNHKNVFRVFCKNMIYISLAISVLCELLITNEPYDLQWTISYVFLLPFIVVIVFFLYIQIVLHTQQFKINPFSFFFNIAYIGFQALLSVGFVYFLFSSNMFAFWIPQTLHSINSSFTHTSHDYLFKSSFSMWIVFGIDALTSASSPSSFNDSFLDPKTRALSVHSFMSNVFFHHNDGLCGKLLQMTCWFVFVFLLKSPSCSSSYDTAKKLQNYFEIHNDQVLMFSKYTISYLIFYIFLVPHTFLFMAKHYFQIFLTLKTAVQFLHKKEQSSKNSIKPLLVNLNLYTILFSICIGVLAYILPMIQQTLLFILFILNWSSHLLGIYHSLQIYMKY